MRDINTATELENLKEPSKLKSLKALNTALKTARASETTNEFISAARSVKELCDYQII